MYLTINYHATKYTTPNPRLGLRVDYMAFTFRSDEGFITYKGQIDLPELCGDRAIQEALVDDAKSNIDFQPQLVTLQKW